MQYGCTNQCPKVREQLRKQRREVTEQSADRDSELREAVAGPSNIQHTKKTPSKRSKESNKYYPGTVSPTRIVRTLHRSHETGGNSPRSLRHGRREPDEYRSGSSSRTDSRDRIPNYVAMQRTAAGKPRDEQRLRYEEPQRRYREFDEGAGPSRVNREIRDLEDDEESRNAHDRCDPHCRGINERIKKVRDEKQRETLDRYLVYEGLPYFGDLCYCSYECLAKQLWSHNFVKSTVTSVGLFAVGLKLFYDLDGWTVPNTF